MFYRVNTIYPAFMGESNVKGIGYPCVFVRLAGCNLRCYSKTMCGLCDTPEALKINSGKAMSNDEIALQVAGYCRDLVCLTGGEPLMQDCTELLKSLTKMGNHVVIETNGSIPIGMYREIPNVSFVMDWKAPSTGEQNKMLKENLVHLSVNDFVKFVIYNEDDYRELVKFYREDAYLPFNIVVGTLWGSIISYEELCNKMWHDNLNNVYLNCQQHKMCRLYDKYRYKLTDIVIPREI